MLLVCLQLVSTVQYLKHSLFTALCYA